MQSAYGFSWSLFLLLPKFLATELHASAGEIGLVSAIPPLAAVAVVPWIGRTLDRVGRRPLITLGTALAALYGFGFLWVDSVGPLLFGLQVIQGLSFSTQFNGAATLVTDVAPKQRLGQAIALFGASNVVMNAVAPTVAELLADSVGWASAFLASAVAGVVALALSLLLDEARQRKNPEQADGSVELPPTLSRDLWAVLCCGAAFATVFAFYQPYALSLGMTEVRSFFYGYSAAVVTMRVGFGSVADRVGRKPVALFSLLLYGLVVAAMTRLGPGTLVMHGAFFGCAHGLFYPAMNALTLENCDERARGKVMAYYNGSFQMGFMVSSFCLGWVAQSYGYPVVFLIGSCVALAGAATLATRRGLTVSDGTP